ncbi:MAG: hypothetical protein ACRDS0_39035 [Pseudonocardiaceae bacterium]
MSGSAAALWCRTRTPVRIRDGMRGAVNSRLVAIILPAARGCSPVPQG